MTTSDDTPAEGGDTPADIPADTPADIPADVTSVFASGLIREERATESDQGADAAQSDDDAAQSDDDAAQSDDDAAPAPSAGGESLPEGTALLVVKRGANAGSRFTLDTESVTVGRHPDSDVFLDDVSVSRRHAEFRRTADGFDIVDVGSLNGTYVNREPVESSALAGGDEVQIGKFRLVYLTGPAMRPEEAAPASGAGGAVTLGSDDAS